MKTIKIFLASSEELKDERLEMTDLVSRLNQTFKGRGIQLELKRWEYLDSSMGDQRKQDEYNNVLRECDICLVLFWRRFGSYTGEELDVAYQCYKNKHKPEKIYVFFKNPDDDDVTTELKEFIKSYEKRYGGHFFNKFLTVDTLKLEFLLQFELYQKDQLGEKAIEVRNEHVYVDNEMVADLNNIPFAANNEGFKKRQAELKELEQEIEKKRKELDEKNAALQLAKDQQANLPNVAGLQMFVDMAQKAVMETEDGLQELLNKNNQLKDEFEREQQNLFNTARRITEQRGQKISERMARAIEAFESGDAQRADIILDEAEKDAERILSDLRLIKEISIFSIDELLLKASVKMANDTIPIDERVVQAANLYTQAITLAKEAGYVGMEYADILQQLILLFISHKLWEKAEPYCLELISFNKREEANIDKVNIANTYNIMGCIKERTNRFQEGKEYLLLAINIWKAISDDHPNLASGYNNLGVISKQLKDYPSALHYFTIAANMNDNCAMENLGILYQEGLGTCVDLAKARELYAKSSELGNSHSSWLLGKMYYNGWGVDKNAEKAFIYFKYAADQGDTDAMNQVGVCFAKGQGTYQSREESIKWYLKAAIKGDALGQYNLGRCYDDGNGLETNKEQALKWYTKSANQGCAEAQCALAIMYNNGLVVEKDATIAVEWFMKAAEQGNDVAQYNLAVNYENGKGITPDKKKAMEWYSKSADKGNKKAQCAIGLMYVNGEIVEQDYDKATDWFVLSANQNYDIAQYMLGTMYEYYNSKHNIKEAIKQYTNAASQNNVNAQHRLGVLYSMGGEVNVDLEKSVMWLEKSANQKNTESYNLLAWNLHLQGCYQEALPWAEKAVEAFPQNPNIIDTLASVYQDLGRYNEALEQFELCLKRYKEQENSEGINRTEAKIAELKELMKNGGVSEQ